MRSASEALPPPTTLRLMPNLDDTDSGLIEDGRGHPKPVAAMRRQRNMLLWCDVPLVPASDGVRRRIVVARNRSGGEVRRLTLMRPVVPHHLDRPPDPDSDPDPDFDPPSAPAMRRRAKQWLNYGTAHQRAA